MRFKEFVATREMELIAVLDLDLLGEGIWDVGAGLLRSADGAATVGDEALAKLVGQGQRGRMRRGLSDFAGGLRRAVLGQKAPQKKTRQNPAGSPYRIEGEKMKFLCPNGHAISIPVSEHGKLVTCPVCNLKFSSPFIGNVAARKEELGVKRFLARQERQEKFKELVDLWKKTKDPAVQKEMATKFPREYQAALAKALARRSATTPGRSFTSPATT